MDLKLPSRLPGSSPDRHQQIENDQTTHAHVPALVAAMKPRHLCCQYKPRSGFDSRDCLPTEPPGVRVSPPLTMTGSLRARCSRSTRATTVGSLWQSPSGFQTSPAFLSDLLRQHVDPAPAAPLLLEPSLPGFHLQGEQV